MSGSDFPAGPDAAVPRLARRPRNVRRAATSRQAHVGARDQKSMKPSRSQAMCNRSRCTLAVALLAGTLAASGCAADATTTGSTVAQPTSPPAAVGTTAQNRPAKRPPHHRGRPRRRHPAPPINPRSGSLAYSTASNYVVQSQAAPGSCHAIGTGLYSRPNPSCTPGALNPAVTQATIDQTICVEGWTATVRPPESITEQEKATSMAAYGDTGSPGDYEYDHFVPLELGGATNDPRNLWPEPGASPNPKDTVENELRQQVCDGQMTLAEARREIVTNWVRLAQPASPSAPGRSGQPVGASPRRRVHHDRVLAAPATTTTTSTCTRTSPARQRP